MVTHQLSADLQAVLTAVADGVVMLDAQGRVLHANGAAARILGVAPNSIEESHASQATLRTIREDGTDFLPDEWPAQVCLRTGARVAGVVVGLWRGDELAWVLVNAEPLRRGPEESPYGVVATFTDITVQVKQREQLRQLTTKLANVLDASTDGYFQVDIPTGAMECSARTASMFGYEPDEVVPDVTAYLARTHPDDQARMRDAVECVYRGETDRFEAELRARHKDGRWLWVLVRGLLAERSANGQSQRLVGSFTDITARKSAEAELMEARTRLSYALEGSDTGIADWHIRSRTVHHNRRWSELLGLEPDDPRASFDNYLQRTHPEDVQAVLAAANMLLDGRTVQFDLEHRVQRSDGRWIWVHARGRVVERDADGSPLRAAGTLTDVTARRQAEAVLRASLADNERLVKELRQALDQVKTLSELLPLCTFCRKVRDDAGYWQNIEQYITAHTDTLFSHGMCPTCVKTFYPDYSK